MMFIGLIKNSSPIFIKNHFSIKYRSQDLKKIYIYHFRIISRFLLPYLGKGIYPKSYKNKNIKAYIGPTYIRTHHSASLQIVRHPYQSHRA